jgi:hypothetical protein
MEAHMTWARWLAVCLAAMPGLGEAHQADAQSRVIRLRAEDAQCISLHLKTYLDSREDPILIVPDACPSATPGNDLGAISARNGVRLSNSSTIVLMTKAEIQCLAKVYKATKRKPLSGYVEINTALCK